MIYAVWLVMVDFSSFIAITKLHLFFKNVLNKDYGIFYRFLLEKKNKLRLWSLCSFFGTCYDASCSCSTRFMWEMSIMQNTFRKRDDDDDGMIFMSKNGCQPKPRTSTKNVSNVCIVSQVRCANSHKPLATCIPIDRCCRSVRVSPLSQFSHLRFSSQPTSPYIRFSCSY